jgi:4-diphosphocytidyl-2-C-methyl-D-erythritol kinase
VTDPRPLRLTAPAKINWTLEVLGKRDDGYHEVRTILQTIDVADLIDFAQASELILSVRGPRAAATPVEGNLLLRAAEALRRRAGGSEGAEMALWKLIPVAAGLGGGSSDAAAVLRGLRQLWKLSISDEELAAIAAELGSDVPFFLRGGTALASSRGERIQPLPDMRAQYLIILEPPNTPPDNKTARMYAALRPKHYTDGSLTARTIDRIRSDLPLRDGDLYNVFEQVLPDVDAEAWAFFRDAAGLGLGQPHLCGAGPALFFLSAGDTAAWDAMTLIRDRLGLTLYNVRTYSAHAMNPHKVPKPDWAREGQRKKR